MGPELSYTDIGVFISSDGGNTWRQVTGRFWDREGDLGQFLPASFLPVTSWLQRNGSSYSVWSTGLAQYMSNGVDWEEPWAGNRKNWHFPNSFILLLSTGCWVLCWLLGIQPITWCLSFTCHRIWVGRMLRLSGFVSLSTRWRGSILKQQSHGSLWFSTV